MHYDIFISYKRKSLPTVNNLYYRLTTRGYSTFFDLEELGRDNFNVQLLSYIEKSKDVFVILEEGSLDGCKSDDWEEDWFCHEIAFALEKKKNIIPILIGGYQMPSEDFFPDKLKELRLKNAPEFNFSFFEAYLDKLIEKDYLLSKPNLQEKATSVFKFYSNEDCQVYKEGKMVCSLERMSDKPYYLPVPRKGEYRFKAVSAVTKKSKIFNENIDAAEEKIVEIKWSATEYEEYNRQKELEAQRKIAIENERKAKEEEKRKAEIEKKRKEELEAQRRKEKEELERLKSEAQKKHSEELIKKATELEPVIGDVIRLVQEGKAVTLPVKGSGMRPFLKKVGSSILLSKIDSIIKGDIVLAVNKDGHARISRVLSIQGDNVILRGDANRALEYYTIHDVFAKAKGFYRYDNKKIDSVSGIKWRLYSCVWVHLPFCLRNMFVNVCDWLDGFQCKKVFITSIILSIVLCALCIFFYMYKSNWTEDGEVGLSMQERDSIVEYKQDVFKGYTSVKDSLVTVFSAPAGRNQYKYSGRINLQSNLPDGYGVAQFDDGAVYEGNFKDGLSNDTSVAVLKFKDGTFYKGSFSKGYYVEGVFTYEDKSYYKGTYKVNKKGEVKKDQGTYFGPNGNELINYRNGKSIIIK